MDLGRKGCETNKFDMIIRPKIYFVTSIIPSIIFWPFKKYCHFPGVIGASIDKSNGKSGYK